MATKAQKAKHVFTMWCFETFISSDRWGNFKFENNGSTYRVKLNKTSWRFEKKFSFGWTKLAGAYYTRTTEKHKDWIAKHR